MARARGGNGRRRARRHHEALPTPRLIAAESAKAVAQGLLLGCAVALLLDCAAMLLALAVVPDAALGSTERLGRGIVAAAATGLVLVGVLLGVLASAARFALAAFYAGLPPKTDTLRDTVLVRGQLARTPSTPASVSLIGLGSLALLALIPCVALAAEHGGRLDDELSRAQFWPWAVAAGALLAAVLVCAAGVWLLVLRDRRWWQRLGSQLPKGVVGDRGPATRITTRAMRRAERRGWGALDRVAQAGRIAVAIGAGVVFLGVYLRQPGLYADPVAYTPQVERVIDAGTVVGAVVLALGILVLAVTGALAFRRTTAALRRAGAGDEPALEDPALLRSATTSLVGAATTLLVWWTVCGVAAAGWWFAAAVTTPADGSAAALRLPSFGEAAPFLAAWLAVGVLLVAARAVLEARGPALRNRFGYEPPSEPDDREYPDLPLFGQ
ncbi:hypothetical protein [Agromyces soli]|uniref:FtsX-like permease family protein n=1 Tax=Agromyces soli TaxID=659012 RepID=A0ABY4AXU4_9MICO|nr:hypothetical protein [Agromyces soli]UOE26586.1 hypothetical protein MTP13_02055 [Agromyces soli]